MERILQAEEVPVSPSCIISAVANGIVVAVVGNPYPVVGWERAGILGRDMATTFIPERYRAAHKAGLARFRENPSQEFPVFGRTLAVEAVGADGQLRDVSLHVFEYDATEQKFFAVITRRMT